VVTQDARTHAAGGWKHEINQWKQERDLIMETANKIEEVVKGLSKLPTLPGIAMKILEVVRNEETSLKEIADILSTDPPLTAEVLRLINSPFYGLHKKVTSVTHAVNLLGIDTVKNLALSFSLLRDYRSGNEKCFDYTLFWKNSLTGAVACKLLGERITPSFAEDAFFLGLIHDIGMLALNRCMPEQYGLVLKEKKRAHCPYHEAENQILGFNHMEVGEYLIKKWALPEAFYMPIRYHHDPGQLKTNDREIEILTKVLHLSSLFIDLSNSSDKAFHLALLEYYAEEYGFLEKLKIVDMAMQIYKQTMNIFPLFEIKVAKETCYLKMIEDARNELINVSADFMCKLLEQKRLIESLREQATRDSLTGLFNYQTFQEFLEKEIYRAKRYKLPLSLILGDLDHFKEINDQYGHLAGDHALKVIGKCLQDSLRKSDVNARYGGEEFGIIMPETKPENAFMVAERLRDAIQSLPIDYEGMKISLTMSFGVASLDLRTDITKTDLIRRADQALYQAKKAGRNRCHLFNE